MISTGFPQANSLDKAIGSDSTCSGLPAKPARPEELIGRYAGLALADLSTTCIARFYEKFERSSGCWLWTAGKYQRGYGMVAIGRYDDGRQINSYAHRVAYVLGKGGIPPGFVVRHTCDVPLCVNPAHLVLGTQGDNNRDTVARRRHTTSRPWLWKVSQADVQAIRASFASGDWLAKAYGISKTSISLIRRDLRRKAA